jgi:hypothetical protein
MNPHAIGIVGAGNSAHALAAYLSSLGHHITLYARQPEKIAAIARDKAITAVGRVEGTFPIAQVTGDVATLCAASETIFLATVTTAYRDVIQTMIPHLRPGQAIVAFSSKLCGSLEIAQTLQESGVKDVRTMETDALFACRIREDGAIWIRGFKAWNLFSGPTKTDTLEYATLLAKFFPGLEPAQNILHRGLTDFGAVAHAVITLANISRIDRQDDFLFYYEGLSERTIVMLEAVEREFNQVAAAYDTTLIPMAELLNRYYGCDTSSLHRAMTSVPNYRHSLAPKTLSHRYLEEDVSCTLLPLQQLAQKANIATPMVDAVITLASLLSGKNLRATGRTLQRLGWDGLSRKEIIQWMAR